MSQRRKTLRRTSAMARTVKRQKATAGHTNVTIRRVTPTDWAICWTERER